MRTRNTATVGATLLLATLVVVSGVLTGCAKVSETEIHERELIAAGRASFRAYCAGCHGRDAMGAGPAAAYLKLPPADLTKISERYGEFPTDVIFGKIDGSAVSPATAEELQMPHWGEIWRGMNPDWEDHEDTRERITELVEYLRSLQGTG